MINNKNLKILFTGVGRRVELVQAFRDAALVNNINLKIYGTDINATAPALAYCDYAKIICPMRDANYIPDLINLCQSENINLIIPTIDTDLYILAQHKQDFAKINTRVLISEPDKIKLCRDKNLTAKFFQDCGLNAPKTFDDINKYNLNLSLKTAAAASARIRQIILTSLNYTQKI